MKTLVTTLFCFLVLVAASPAVARAQTTLAQTAVASDPASPGEGSAACLEDGAEALDVVTFDGRRFAPSGKPEPIDAANLVRVGVQNGVPLYVGTLSVPPHVDLWLPLCRPAGNYRLYTESQ